MAYRAGPNVVALAKKYTQEPVGIWASVKRIFSVDPNRSTGIPVKNFRDPPPGGLDPTTYDDPVTLPAGDIADNPYWRRDARRAYPRLSTVTQSDVVGLLTVGSAANPSPKLLAGEEGSKQLVAVKQEGQKGLAAYFETESGKSVMGPDGLPPKAPGYRLPTAERYELLPDQSYKDQYPCRTFN